MKNGSLLSILTIFFTIWGCQVSKKIDPRILQARVIVEQVRDSSKVPGIAITVIKKGEIALSEGFGYSDLESETPVDPAKTLFRIGSVSKSVTAIGLGILMEEGKIDLDTSIYFYLPEFPQKRWDFTTRQAAGHLAGIRHYRNDEFVNNKHYPDVISGLSIFMHDSLLFEPGSQYRYSTYGWNLVSAIMERAASQPFLEFMQTRIFDPLELTNLQPELKGNRIQNLSSFYQLNENEIVAAPEVDNSYKWAGGGFISTTEDLAKFAHKVFFDYALLEESTVEQLIVPMTLPDGESTNYGLGWRTGEDERGHFYIGHSGGSVGGITMLIIYPEEKIVAAMLSNSSNVRYQIAYSKIAWLFMDSEAAD